MEHARRWLLLPGWQNSGPDHWQSRWERRFGFERVEQSDWLRPLRGDWMARLDSVLRDDPRPAVLIAHSLGCHLVAHWAGHSGLTTRVAAALLVAPPDVARADFPPALHTWRPARARPLPFPARLVYSGDDPYADAAASRTLAQAWGAEALDAGACGHLNADSGLGDWPEGLAWLQGLAGPLPDPVA